MSASENTSTESSAEFRQAAVLFLAAAAVRAALTAWTTLGAGEVRGDAIEYTLKAANFLRFGRMAGMDGMLAARMPLYPLFLAAVFRLAGPSVRAAQAAQILVGAGTCVLIRWGARAFLSERAAFLAGWAAVFYFGLAYPCGRLLTEFLFAFWLALLFAAWMNWRPGARGAMIAVCAASVGLYLTRPEGLLAGAAVAACGPWLKPGWRPRHSAAVLLGLFLAVGAWSARNRVLLGRFLPGTTNAGFSFNAALPRTLDILDKQAAPATPSFDGEFARDRYFWETGRERIKRAGLIRSAEAAGYNLISIYYPFLPGYEATFVLLAPLWLASFFFLREGRLLRPAAALVAGWSVLFVFFGGADSRLRQLFAPLLIWLAAWGFQELERRAPRRAWNAALAGWTSFNVLIFLFSDRIRDAVLALRRLKYGV
jgi:hypothetical protein